MFSKKSDSEQWSARFVKAHLPPPLETTSDLTTTSADLREVKRDLAILSQTVNKLRGAAASSEHKLDDIDKELAELRDQVRSQAQLDRLNNTASYYTDMTEGATSMASEVASTATALEKRLRRLESQSAEHKRQACLAELAIIENQQDCLAKMHDQDARLAKIEQLLQEILPSRSKDVQPQVVGKVTFAGDGSSDTSSTQGHQNAVANAPHAAKPPQKDEHLEDHFPVLEHMFAAREEACKSELDMLKSRVSALEASKPQARQSAISCLPQDSLETPHSLETAPSYKLSLGLFSSSGDRIEFNKMDEETQYTFQPSVWDLSLFIGTPLFGLGENIVIFLFS